MSVVYSCLVEQHDLRLVLLAVLVCGLGTFTAMNLLSRAQHGLERSGFVWLGTAALVPCPPGISQHSLSLSLSLSVSLSRGAH